ncbi:NADP-dependent phosphogluconate dehydrogenase [Paraferrimonas sp. SM1919]|uniref:NADP-dependent phosphogluconate dehydrogenase n=1 Tax=Paraferrimonas sp. SM1919 TaxID=2662263 RepID=UPI0013D61FBF|nr:NADP-dependent phosphogluconate dehydrogenase [Paraferrimonas sp. SM1919]
MSSPSNDRRIGFIGLGVMGGSLSLNLADNGYQVYAFDLDSKKTEHLINQDALERGDKPQRIFPCTDFKELLEQLPQPRTIILSIPAGAPVDAVCEQLMAAGLNRQDIVVDTGNSLWTDTKEREDRYKEKFNFFSTAVSGGEVGARFGPSLMPSGPKEAWHQLEPIFHAIAAKVDPKTGKPIERFEPGNPVKEGEACATYIGDGGAGHYVKMVHNGIEYADMQLICEAYHLMRSALDMTPAQIADVFRLWDQGPLNSYLIGISAEVLDQVEPENNQPLVDIIVDKAGQKGTGLWTAVSSLQVGAPAPSIAAAVFARGLSSLKDERIEASKVLQGPANKVELEQIEFIGQLEQALYSAKVCAYAQGFHLMDMAAKENGWNLDFAEIAKIWRAGCIIRAGFLQSITEAYQENPDLKNLLVAPYFAEQVNRFQNSWRQIVAKGALVGIPCGAISSALSYYDSYRLEVLPANLLQGQRDFFGAHTFERTDVVGNDKYHVLWSGDRSIVKI